jgi:hypothetical protein
MKHNEQQNCVGFLLNSLQKKNMLSSISNHHKCEKPLSSPTFATFIQFYIFHQCSRGNAVKNENQSNAT